MKTPINYASTKKAMQIVGYASINGFKSFCKRNGIDPVKKGMGRNKQHLYDLQVIQQYAQ